MTNLLCPKCRKLLRDETTRLVCTGCGSTFPVIDDIPRLIEQDFYWGEIEKGSARRMVDRAKEIGWKNSIDESFGKDNSQWTGMRDWQRTSWIPLLGLPEDSVVLDIGSGYGALTHSLAANFNEVHSMEAIPERIEFTQQRLKQEGLHHTHLVQGSALNLPYPDNMFDAIVVNGVLEWIGDWIPEGDPRDIQVAFLKRVHGMLKPTGKLYVGIENRIGYNNFQGAIDHSGMGYTSLLPRPLATVALRVFGKRHHRMTAPSREYRTYTYSEPGFRKLFADGGFAKTASFWPEPGYNQPYQVSSLEKETVQTALAESRLRSPNPSHVSVVGRLKQALANAGVFKQVVPDFMFIISKDGTPAEDWKSLVPTAIAKDPRILLTTRKLARQTTIRVLGPSGEGVALTSSTPAPGSRELISTAYANLQSLNAIAKSAPLSFGVPMALGSLPKTRSITTAESMVAGNSASSVFLPSGDRLGFLRANLPKFAEVASAISALPLNVVTSEQWVASTEPIAGAEVAARLGGFAAKYAKMVSHGDFTLSNIIMDDAGQVSVIDWGSAVRATPPIYDLVTLLLSAAAGAPVESQNARFRMSFLEKNDWSLLFAGVISAECQRLGIALADAREMFVDALICRLGFALASNADNVHLIDLAKSIRQEPGLLQF